MLFVNLNNIKSNKNIKSRTMKIITSYILILLVWSSTVIAQTKNDETIENVRELIIKKQYSKAENLLKNYYPNHVDDLQTNWLYAQVLHWTNKNDLSEEKFNKAITLAPNNNTIQLDFARMLYESNRFNKAQLLLNNLKFIDETKAEALLMLATIYFWNGNIVQANETIAEIKKAYPETKITDELTKNITQIKKFNLNTEFEYQSDNQPLKYLLEKIEIGQYQSWLLNPKFEISNTNFNPTKQTFTSNLSNKFYFYSIGLSASTSIGIYKNFSDKTDWIGEFNLNKKIVKNTTFKLGLNKKPYVGTLASTTFNLTQNNFFSEIDYENNKLLSFHTGFNNQFFSDKNTIKSFSSWILTKPYQLSNLKVQLGYGFNYSDSNINTYIAKESLNQVITNFNPNESIEGYYNPYFTPKNQSVNSLLLILNYKLTNRIDFYAKGNYGFSANCQNPFIYLNTDSMGNIIFVNDSNKVTFNPYDITGTLAYSVLSNFGIKLTFIHQETFFYNKNNINLSLNYKF